jgi:hypothetical protein
MKRFCGLVLLLYCSAVCGQDRDLDYFISRATHNSPLLKDYQNQVSANQVDSQLLRASYKVQVNGISNDYYAPVYRGIGYDNIITNGGQLSALVQANKAILSNANLASQYQSIQLQNEALGNSAVIAGKDLKKTITAQYVTVYGDMVALNFNREILALFREEEDILKKLTQANTYRQTDYLTFYVSLQQQQLSVRQSEIQFRNDCAILNYLSGIVDTAAITVRAPDLRVGSLPDIFQSSFYRQYTIDSLKFINPKLNVFADAGYISSFTLDPYKNFGAGVGLNFTVPIYDGKQRQLKNQKINIAERSRQQYRDFFMHQYDQQIAQLLQQLNATESLIQEINGQIRYANTLVEVNKKLLETGEVRITDLILAINTFLNARNLLNQNYVNRMQIINQINYWEAS